VGLATDGILKGGIYFLPLLVFPDDKNNHRPFVRACVAINDDASIVCSGKMPEGAQITFASCGVNDVMSASKDAAARSANERDINAALIFSCVVRQFVTGAVSMDEIQEVSRLLPSDIPFMASYSAGGYAPTLLNEDNTAQNRYHNFTLIMCLL
jgi:hypothetical protein